MKEEIHMKTRRKYLVGLLAATLVLTGMPVQHTQAAKAAKLSSKKVTLKVGKSKTITIKNNLSLIHISEPTRPY